MRASIIVASLNEGDRLWRTVALCLEDIGRRSLLHLKVRFRS
jgi:hypothetical protein